MPPTAVQRALAVAVLMSGCGGARPSATPSEPLPAGEATSRPVPLRAEIEPLGDTTRVDWTCNEGTPDRCNALDDDCSGRIDAGCGYGGRRLQITVAWNRNADVRLGVTDPRGDTIDASNPHVRSGGRLDHHVGCEAGADTPRVEDVTWAPGRTPPAGRYGIHLSRRSCDGDKARETTATVSVSVDGRVFGPFNHTLTGGEPIPVLRLKIKHAAGGSRGNDPAARY